MINKKIYSLLIIIGILFISQSAFANESVFYEEHEPSMKFLLWAVILGGLSAISLVLGSFLGLAWQPKPKVIASFTAFGAGALLAALSVELIAPTVMEFTGKTPGSQHDNLGHESLLEFIFLLVGCILGGIIFYLLNEALNNKGGYLRKKSTTIAYFNHQRLKRFRVIFDHLSKFEFFKAIPLANLDVLVQKIRMIQFKSGKRLFAQGDRIRRLYVIEEGEADIFYNHELVKTAQAGEFLGETAVLSNKPVEYEAVAHGRLKVFEITQNDIHILRDTCPEIKAIIEDESKHEWTLESKIKGDGTDSGISSKDWSDEAASHLHANIHTPSQKEINADAEKKDSAPLSIWLGIFLDGIPESFVIGAGFLILLSSKLAMGAVSFVDVVPFTLIAGLFLSNFPEAMSSSIGMKKMGWKPMKIFLLWFSLMLMTAVGAGFGYYYGAKIPNYLEIGVEGIASGAMLTMIAQTMIPEAVHIGGSRVTGLSTLAGFIAAVAFKIFE